MKNLENVIALLNKSHSPFHVVSNLVGLLKADFRQVDEGDLSSIEPGEDFLLTRNGATFAAVRLPKRSPKAIKIVATHNDSPTFKVKPNPVFGKDVAQLNVEPYGGMIMYSWFDRPLSLAGRLVYEKDGVMQCSLVDVNEDILIIPSLCIHMNREVNSGHAFNPAKELNPVLGLGSLTCEEFTNYLYGKAGLADVKPLAHDLFLYVREDARLVGANQEFLVSPRLDDLSSAYSAGLAFAQAKKNEDIVEIFVSFDNEEVGSLTRQGAASTFLKDLVETVCHVYSLSDEDAKGVIARSFLFSVDNAHANHPNYPEISDRTTNVVPGQGVVIKYNAQAKYTSDGLSAGYAKCIAEKAGVGVQEYTNRSDMRGGSTLGNISNSEISLNSADIGIAQWAMHSSVETQAASDIDAMVNFLKTFFESDFLPLY